MERPAEEQDEHRRRLLDGFAVAIAEKGYAATTIADVVRHARVSKRTFYEHFADKEACLLATYAGATARIREAMVLAFAGKSASGWMEQVEAVVDAYVTALEAMPSLTRACLVEMAAAGPRALKLRREVREAFASMLRELVEHAHRIHPEVRPISEPMATAIVGGIDELLLAQVEGGPQHRLANLRETATELMIAVLTRPAVAPKAGGREERRARRGAERDRPAPRR